MFALIQNFSSWTGGAGHSHIMRGAGAAVRHLVVRLRIDDWRWVQLPKSYNKRTFYQVKTSSEVLFRQPSSLRTSGTSTTPAPSRLACPEDYTCDARGARGRAWRGMCGKAVRPVSMSSM